MIGKIVKDSFSCAVVPFVKIAITFIMAPVIVHALGNYDYGIWEMVFAIIGYMEFLDFGLMPAIVRNVARCHAMNDKEELQRIYSTALAFFLIVGLILSVAFMGGVEFVANRKLNEAFVVSNKYSMFFIIIAIQVFFVFVGSVFDCCLEGAMLYNMRNMTTVIFSIVGAIIIYPLLKGGGGLLTLAVANACGFSLKYIFYGLVLRCNRYGGFRFSLKYISMKTFKGLFSFGVKSFIWSTSLRISILSDPLVIGSFLGAAVVPFYMIPSNLVGQARNIVWSVTRVFLPVFSGLDALNEQKKARELYLGASRFMVGIVVPLIAGICMLGPSFISHWMGSDYGEKGRVVLYVLSTAYLIQWLNPFSRRFLTAIDKHEILAWAGMISAILNLGLSIILVKVIGPEGVAIGTLLPVIIFEPYFLYKTCRELNCSVLHYVRNVFFPILVPASALVVFIYAAKIFFADDSMFSVILMALGSLAVYLPAFMMCAVKPDERHVILLQVRQKVFSGV